ncbi:hypothetical protein [Mycolicibacter kumamotonensis]|uniref:hypothetical protein n=1 Tax=Mycolicibacter kumamotonensis TaxID=354243 RepID=UPI00080661BD|nr:hypothetical protein [Mycolicibacter kumamotonensis]
MPPDDDSQYAPSVFMSDYDLPDPSALITPPLPDGTEDGVIEFVKRAVVVAVREALTASGITVIGSAADSKPDDNTVYVDLEYPLKKIFYPGVWVQFSITSLQRAGISQETTVKIDGVWTSVQEQEVRGRVTLTTVALYNKDRDRLAGKLTSLLGFARGPQMVLTDPTVDVKQNRTLLDALCSNPYMSISINTDVQYPGGQNTTVGVPWQPDVLAYEDSYAFDVLGYFTKAFSHDGIYELSRIDVDPEIAERNEPDTPTRF